jgi:Ni,Fe-hydrogenase III large subunit
MLASMDRLLQSLMSQTKPRKRHPATDIRRIEAATGKIVIGVTIGDDGRVTSYTFAGGPATNLFAAEADEELEQWKRKKNAGQS